MKVVVILTAPCTVLDLPEGVEVVWDNYFHPKTPIHLALRILSHGTNHVVVILDETCLGWREEVEERVKWICERLELTQPHLYFPPLHTLEKGGKRFRYAPFPIPTPKPQNK